MPIEVCEQRDRKGLYAMPHTFREWLSGVPLTEAADDDRASGKVFEVYVSKLIEVCEQRDRKGLYAKVRAGVLKEFIGVSDPYGIPRSAWGALRHWRSVSVTSKTYADAEIDTRYISTLV